MSGPGRMPALTLRQPWAFCVARGGKRVENRGWPPPAWLGEFAVHAGARSGWDPGADADPPVLDAIRAHGRRLAAAGALPAGATVAGVMTFGAVVAVVSLGGWHHFRDCGGRCSPWARPGQYHWCLAGVRTLISPIPCRGWQGIWRLTGSATAAAGPACLEAG